ncbi:MAG: dehydrogenase [Clostridia bacterium]|nr:dehydrogenase [Clostridia bacterium]
MKIDSRAPLRIGLAGGGTDLASYSDRYGGVVLNATIGMYAYCTIIPTNDKKIKIYAYDNQNSVETKSVKKLDFEGDRLILHKGVYNRIVKDYNGGKPLSFVMSTSNDAPIGSGLGTSSTMIVAILEAFNCWLGLGLSDYEKAQLAYKIEREDLGLAGGKQDQYAAVFGGFNIMEFKQDGSTIVNSLRLDKSVINELECSLLLYYSGQSRKSADIQLELTKNIISNQISNTKSSNFPTIDAMKHLKDNAYEMKDNILTGNMEAFAASLRAGWEAKKKTSSIVSNVELEKTINYALANGAEAVKVSGAGGGGFLLLYCDPMNRQKLINAMDKLSGKIYPVKFSKSGAESWRR